MESEKPTRAAVMAATYGEILVKAGVIKPQKLDTAPIATLHHQIIRGEVSWWDVCIGQLPVARKK